MIHFFQVQAELSRLMQHSPQGAQQVIRCMNVPCIVENVSMLAYALAAQGYSELSRMLVDRYGLGPRPAGIETAVHPADAGARRRVLPGVRPPGGAPGRSPRPPAPAPGPGMGVVRPPRTGPAPAPGPRTVATGRRRRMFGWLRRRRRRPPAMGRGAGPQRARHGAWY